jgi:hypothetical protein
VENGKHLYSFGKLVTPCLLKKLRVISFQVLLQGKVISGLIGAMRTALQCLEVLGVIPVQPAIENPGTDVKAPTGKAGITAMGIVVIKPFQSFIGIGGNIPYPFAYGYASRS